MAPKKIGIKKRIYHQQQIFEKMSVTHFGAAINYLNEFLEMRENKVVGLVMKIFLSHEMICIKIFIFSHHNTKMPVDVVRHDQEWISNLVRTVYIFFHHIAVDSSLFNAYFMSIHSDLIVLVFF